MALTSIQAICIGVFAIAGATVVYTLFGYPLLLGWMAKRHEQPVHRDEVLRSVSFVIAVHNGETFLERKLSSILALNYPRELVEMIVVSDGSDDRTDEIVRSFAPHGVRLVQVPRGGKPAALNVAVPMATGEIWHSPIFARRCIPIACAMRSPALATPKLARLAASCRSPRARPRTKTILVSTGVTRSGFAPRWRGSIPPSVATARFT